MVLRNLQGMLGLRRDIGSMSSLAKGREWMEERAKTRIHKSLIFVETSRFQVQKDSLKDYRKEKLTPTEIRNNKMYLKDNCLYR